MDFLIDVDVRIIEFKRDLQTLTRDRQKRQLLAHMQFQMKLRIHWKSYWKKLIMKIQMVIGSKTLIGGLNSQRSVFLR